MSNVPPILHLFRNVGYFLDIFTVPCAPNPLIFAEIAVKAALKVGVSQANFDIKEIFHKTTGDSIIHTMRREAKETEVIDDSAAGEAFKHVFQLGSAADYAVFFCLFVPDQLFDGIIDFTSQVVKMEACLHPYPPSCGYGIANIGASFDKGRWSEMGEFAIQMPSIWGPVWPCVYVAGPESGITVGWWGTPSDFFGVPAQGSTRLVNITTGQVLLTAENTQDKDGNWGRLAAWSRYIPTTPGHSYMVQGTAPGPMPLGEVFWKDAGCWITATNRN